MKTKTTRHEKDFAIEFGEYLARSAEHFMKSVDEYLEGKDDGDAALSDGFKGLKSSTYEFRKRSSKVI